MSTAACITRKPNAYTRMGGVGCLLRLCALLWRPLACTQLPCLSALLDRSFLMHVGILGRPNGVVWSPARGCHGLGLFLCVSLACLWRAGRRCCCNLSKVFSSNPLLPRCPPKGKRWGTVSRATLSPPPATAKPLGVKRRDRLRLLIGQLHAPCAKLTPRALLPPSVRSGHCSQCFRNRLRLNSFPRLAPRIAAILRPTPVCRVK